MEISPNYAFVYPHSIHDPRWSFAELQKLAEGFASQILGQVAPYVIGSREGQLALLAEMRGDIDPDNQLEPTMQLACRLAQAIGEEAFSVCYPDGLKGTRRADHDFNKIHG